MCLDTTIAHGHAHGHARDRADDGDTTAAGGRVSRRGLLRSGAVAAAGGVLTFGAAAPAVARGRGPADGVLGRGRGRGPRGVVDLTHRLTKDYPDFFGAEPVISDTVDFDIATDGFYSKSWTFPEHIGTHMDAPGHFSPTARLVDELPADELVAPLVVVDIRDKADEDPNATVEPADLVAHERRHGRIPRGAFVAMWSGWQERFEAGPDAYRGGVGFPDLAFPGFSVDATDWLVARRDPVGIGVDTLSLDPGDSTDFAVHVGFLGSDRYGIENLANLSQAPARGATAFIGAVPWEDGSGGPCRVLAVR